MPATGPLPIHRDHELGWVLEPPDFLGFTAQHFMEIDAHLAASDAAWNEGAAAMPAGDALIAAHEQHTNTATGAKPAVVQDTTQPTRVIVRNTTPLRTSHLNRMGAIDYSVGKYIAALNGNPIPDNPSTQPTTPDTGTQVPACERISAAERETNRRIAPGSRSRCP